MSACKLLLPLLLLLASAMAAAASPQQREYEYCIVGAGPSGLQLGHLMHEAGRDYVILERAAGAGSFFEKFPRHERLISINKRHADSRNTEYSLRHDWNSLLSRDPSLLFRHYSSDMFPRRQDMLRYLRDFARKLQLRIRYGTNVTDARLDDRRRFVLLADSGRFVCDVVVAATGLWLPRRLRLRGLQHTVGYEQMSLDRSRYEGKRLLIIGKGNTAFETAAHLYGSTQLTHLLSRGRLRLAWSTHYVGDLRAVNNELLDTYQLKSVDAMFEADADDCELRPGPDGRLLLLPPLPEAEARLLRSLPPNASVEVGDSERLGFRYDVVIRAAGFRFDASWLRGFNLTTTVEDKYPLIGGDFAAKGVANLFVAGAAAHSLDFRRAAGGFVHGFRYSARALHRLLSVARHRQPWPALRVPLARIIDVLLRRINEGSGTYQMFATLGDVLLIHRQRGEFTLLEEFPVQLATQLPRVSGHNVTDDVIIFVFEYGRSFSGPGKDVFHENRASCDTSNGYACNFLHPVLYHYTSVPAADGSESRSPSKLPLPARLLHLAEDVHTNFRTRVSHVMPLTSFLESVLGRPLWPLSLERCLLQSLLAGSDVSDELCERWSSWSGVDMFASNFSP